MLTAKAEHTREPEAGLNDYLHVVLRRRKVFFLAFLTVLAGVIAFTFLMKPVYEAEATLHVKEEPGKGTPLGELLLNSVNPIESELEIVKSRTNAEKVVKRLHLDWKITKKSDSLAFKILEFSSSAEEPSYRIELTGADTYAVTDDSGTVVGSGKSGVLLRGKDVVLLLTDLHGNNGDRFRLELLPFNDTVDDLRETIKVAEVRKKTNIIRIAYRGKDPVLVKDVVNTLVQAYLEQSVSFKSEEANKTVMFVEQQLEDVRKGLDSAEKNLQAYKTTAGTIQLDTEAEALVRKISETEQARAEVALQKKQAEFALASFRDSIKRGTIYSPAVLRDDRLIVDMSAKLAELQIQKRSLLADYTEEHPAVKAVQEQINELQSKVQSTYETSLQNLNKQEESIGRQISSYEGEMKRLPAMERQLAGLVRLSRVNADTYTFLLQKHEEARIARASTISNIDIVDPAIVPDKPVRPKKLLNLLLALVIGGLLGTGAAFFQEHLDDTIKDTDGAKRELGLPVLAVIPYIPQNNGEAAGAGKTLITRREPKSAIAEVFRSLRTNIHFSTFSKKQQVFLITSSFSGEGKTTVFGNYAVSLSQTGAKVLLVDCDLRRPALHAVFGHSKTPGITDILAGDAEFMASIHNTGISGVDLVSAGTTPPNPAELLGSGKMRAFLESVRGSYDYILLDAPPLLVVTDAHLLASMSDMVIVVLETGRVPLKTVRHLREVLQNIGTPLSGVIVNNKNADSMSFYGYRDRYYGYGAYQGEEYAAKGNGDRQAWWEKWRRR